MLWTIVASLLFVGRVLGQQTCDAPPGRTQSGDNNFVIDYFSGALLFTYAIGQCTAVDLTDDTTFVKYACSQVGSGSWKVTKSTYNNKACTGSPTVVSWNDSNTEAGQLHYFKCDGDNNYARIQISTDSACAGSLDVYGGLGNCAQNPSSFDTKFYCNATSALVQLYVNPSSINATQIPMCEDNALYCTKWNFRASGCALSAVFAGVPVYGKMITCSASADVVTTSMMTTGTGMMTTTGDATDADTTDADTTDAADTTEAGEETTMLTEDTTEDGEDTTDDAEETTTKVGTTTTKAADTTSTTEMDTTSSAKSFSVLSAIVALVALFY
jgi:hypothetical protein